MSGAVVVGVDGSEPAVVAARWAVREAALWRTSLTVLTVAEAGADRFGTAAEKIAEAVRDELTATATEVPIATATSVADVESALRAASADALLLALGPPTGTLSGLLAGTPDADLLARAGCPVVVVRGAGADRVAGPVVVGVDGSPVSDAAVSWAFEEAARRSTRLVALHAVHDGYDGRRFAVSPAALGVRLGEAERRAFAQRLGGWRERFPDVDVEPVLERDRPRDRLLERSEEAAVVVLGSRGRGGFTGMVLGSTTHALLHHADCPVLVVGGEPGARSPRTEDR
ncbi:universal stress protein [Amycolatopsis rhabdoformis]|uniref:Universal stress protein n=1 Tax=Amycolatopsis rhabdoformis TaxID=1448059 RepID=A0ABZ1IDE6_9PSEU|nr:universal stress protein [Amycolatopsis rhabdoformis]WSE32173.1 universal stress protein [Amycolatopsis rhabdoformis]